MNSIVETFFGVLVTNVFFFSRCPQPTLQAPYALPRKINRSIQNRHSPTRRLSLKPWSDAVELDGRHCLSDSRKIQHHSSATTYRQKRRCDKFSALGRADALRYTYLSNVFIHYSHSCVIATIQASTVEHSVKEEGPTQMCGRSFYLLSLMVSVLPKWLRFISFY